LSYTRPKPERDGRIPGRE